MKATTAVLAALLAAAAPAAADVIKLKNGGRLEGVIVREKDDGVVIRLKYATVELDRSEIESVEKTAPAAGPGGKASRLPRWDRCVEVLAPREWEGRPRQVPALVIETGAFRNVPYLSFRAGNYEFNLYGDPDQPAAVELGVYKELLKSDAAKKRCVDAIADLMGDPKDAEVLRGLGFVQGKREREGFVFEITPETAEDAFGGWWVSAYDPAALDKARATQEELDRISATREEMERQAEAVKAEEKRRRDEAAKKRAEEKKSAEEKKADERKAEAERRYSEPPPPPPDYTGTADDWVTGWYLWGRYNPGQIRPPLRPRPTPLPAARPPRYYTPGYSRTGGSYKAGPRLGGGLRR